MRSGRIEKRWQWWDRHHTKVGWVTLGALVGGVLAGWISSAATACAGHGTCRIHWPAVEAIGTWFGAVGGLLAVGAAIATFRSSELNRIEERRRESLSELQKEADLLASARRVRVRAGFGGGLRNAAACAIHELRVWVVNDNTHATVYRAHIHIDDGIEGIDTTHQELPTVKPSWEEFVSFQALERNRSNRNSPPPPVVPLEEEQSWYAEIASRVTLVYVIDNVTWCRVGSNEPERYKGSLK